MLKGYLNVCGMGRTVGKGECIYLVEVQGQEGAVPVLEARALC